jgi:seryl-tRNA synthetase
VTRAGRQNGRGHEVTGEAARAARGASEARRNSRHVRGSGNEDDRSLILLLSTVRRVNRLTASGARRAQRRHLRKELDERLALIGNIVHDSVPVSNDEARLCLLDGDGDGAGGDGDDEMQADNGIVRQCGEVRPHQDGVTIHHHELLYRIDGFEPEAGALFSRSRTFLSSSRQF